jgi:DNA-binding transcriptional MerR regulator
MGKAFTQITFDFGPPSGKEILEEDAPVNGKGETEALGQEEKLLPLQEEEEPMDLQVAAISVVPREKKKSTRGRRSLKEIALNVDLVQVPEDEVLFSKQYYSIGEVATMFREKQSLIRYWETEFDILKPRKNKKGDRFFRPVDVKNLVMIYDLLRRRKFTIEGAKEYLRKEKKAEEKFEMIQSLRKIREFFLELKASLTN